MREISLDATNWRTLLDFYAALLPAIVAPAWHSAGVPAIGDSMINGCINKLKPPHVMRIYNMGGVPAGWPRRSDGLWPISPARGPTSASIAAPT